MAVPGEQEGRRLAAIMFTDIVGFTASTQASEARAMALLETHNAILRPYFPEFNGREVKTIGDSFLVEFDSALDALRCAAEIQSRLHGYNEAATEEGKIRLRIGIHLGDVIHKGGDVFGDAVNISSRIQPLAEPEGVCISRQVYDQVRNKFDLPLVSLGPKTLKNVEGQSEVFRLVMPWERKEGAPEGVRLDPRRIAVLPFVSLSPDPNDEYFADGLTEELITKVSFVQGLEVIARTSAMNYKKKEKNASEIGRELKVGTLLEGSVRKAGNRIRVTAQLINASTEGNLWAESYDRDLDDIFEVQSSVAQNVASALKLKLLAVGEAESEPKVGSEAYTMYLKATHFLGESTPSTLREARRLFEEVIKKDPSFARAYAGLVRALWNLVPIEPDGRHIIDLAERAAEKAVELAPELAEAHVAMADVHTAMDRFEEARAELQRAIELNPNLAVAYDLLGTNYMAFGMPEEGTAAFRKAYSLDPLSAGAGVTLAQALRMDGKTAEALELLEKLRVLHPKSAAPLAMLAVTYTQNGDFAKADESLRAAEALEPGDPEFEIYKGWLAAKKGDRAQAEESLRKLADPTKSVYSNAVVMIRGELGEMDAAYEELMKMAERHSGYASIKVDPAFAPIRADPRFKDFCVKVGLPP